MQFAECPFEPGRIDFDFVFIIFVLVILKNDLGVEFEHEALTGEVAVRNDYVLEVRECERFQILEVKGLYALAIVSTDHATRIRHVVHPTVAFQSIFVIHFL